MGPDPSERVLVAVGVFATLLIVLAACIVATVYVRRWRREARSEKDAGRTFFVEQVNRVLLAIGQEQKLRLAAERQRLYEGRRDRPTE